ncbi:MAG: CinA family protein [Gammaproteobacteria bacterium]|jgi:nicotinamide-nucleotide amidase
MLTSNFQNLSETLAKILLKKNFFLATAESCTGGLVAELITAIPGASRYFDRGFIAYNNVAKTEMLCVKEETLIKYGAVSEEVAKEMAEGAIKNSNAEVSLAITGVAGPSGGSEHKPVGLVCFAWALPSGSCSDSKKLSGDRASIQQQSAKFALQRLIDLLQS